MSDAAAPVRPRWYRRALGSVVILLAAALLATPWWVPSALARLDYFHIRSVEVQGLRYASAAEIVETLGVDTTRSVWDDMQPLVRRLEAHPQVRRATIARRLPATLVVDVEEEPPVALVAGNTGLEAVDEAGIILPLDPSRVPADLPIIASADSSVLRMLANVRRDDPRVFNEISEVRRTTPDELLLKFASVRIRTGAEVSAQRIADALLVEEDLLRRGLTPAELDLRFRHQVIARVQ